MPLSYLGGMRALGTARRRAAGAGGARAGGVAGVAQARMPGGPGRGSLSHDSDIPGHLWR